MHAYWVRFEKVAPHSPLNLGVGVTAIDWDDAQALIAEQVAPLFGTAAISDVTPDFDIEKLDAHHVRPNMGNPLQRGVWFPNLGMRIA